MTAQERSVREQRVMLQEFISEILRSVWNVHCILSCLSASGYTETVPELITLKLAASGLIS